MPRTPGPLSERDMETLVSLAPFHMNAKQPWARPLDVGASNSSHHSKTLRKLVDRRFARLRKNGMPGDQRGSNSYQITHAGVMEIKRWVAEQGKQP